MQGPLDSPATVETLLIFPFRVVFAVHPTLFVNCSMLSLKNSTVITGGHS